MNTEEPEVQPLSQRHRHWTFMLLVALFIAALPFLYLYATGYRFEFGTSTTIVSTGGMYVAAERSGAEIYIDGELVRETRFFRTAFYAQNLDPGTHRVHVQKEDHHTWVKELPISPHLVTEAQAFNMPLSPEVRVLSAWQSATGSAIVATSSLLFASTTNDILATTTKATSTFTPNVEYKRIVELFATSSATSTQTFVDVLSGQIDSVIATTSTSTLASPTTTKEWRGVRLFEVGENIYARWIGSYEDMPYYYCAEDFEPYSTSTEPVAVVVNPGDLLANTAELIHPVQTVGEDAVCDPEIKLEREEYLILTFDFYPGSIDLVLMARSDGVYVVEIDNRAWQNTQPLVMGEGLDIRVENGVIYVYDGELIYQIILE